MEKRVVHPQMEWATPLAEAPGHRRAAGGGVVSLTVVIVAWGLFLSAVLLVGLRLAGYQFISVRGNSMAPAFSAGSLLLARPTPPESVRIGDIIAFPGPSEAVPRVVHRVVALLDQDSEITVVTMGDSNAVPDPAPITLEGPVARVVWVTPYAGWWVTRTTGWLLLSIGILLTIRALASSAPEWSATRLRARLRSCPGSRVR